MSRNKLQLALLATASLLLALLIVWLAVQNGKAGLKRPSDSLQAAGMVALSKPRPLPELSFQTSENIELSTRDMHGKWYLLYFGYTYCPDICPTSLAEMRHIYRLLDEDLRPHVEFIMVTVDPARDTASQLRAYLDFFHPDFKGLTGNMSDIQSFSNALGIPFIPGDTSKPGYTVDHSGNLAIISPDGLHFGFVQAPFKIERVAEQLSRLAQTTKSGL